MHRQFTRRLAAVVLALAPLGLMPARAETRAIAFPTALRLSTLNNLVASRTAPVTFVGARDTDTVFAFDPRTGAGIGQVEVGDGPLAIAIHETAGRRLLGVTCDGFLGESRNVAVLVDATDPAAMRVARTVPLPDGYVFFLGYKTLRFVAGGTAFLVTATDLETARAILLAYDVETGAELGRVDVGFVPGSIDVVEAPGRSVAVISQSVAPRGRITIVDVTSLAAPRVERTIKLPRKSGLYNINNVALAPDGRTGFVATGDGNAVFAFEVDTGRVLSRTVTGDFPTYIRVLSVGGAPRLLVTNENASDLSIYDVSDPEHPSLAALYDAPTFFLDVEPAVSGDGRMAYAASTVDRRVFAVDLSTGSLVYQASAGERVVSATVWEGGGERYACYAATESASVTTLRDGSSGYDVHTFSGPAGGVLFTLYQNVVLSGDGRTAFLASKLTNELFAFDVATGALVGRAPVAAAPSQVAVAEDASGRRRVAVLGSKDGTMTVVDATVPSSLAVSGTVSFDAPYPFYLEYANVVVTGDGTTAFVADGSQFVYAVDLASASVVGSVGTGFVPITVALHEDRGRRRLAVLNAMLQSTSVTVLDVTNPAAMSRVSEAPLPADLVVALNNVPRFTADGRYVLVGASLSESLMSIDAETGRVAGTVAKTSAVVPAPYLDGDVQKFAAVNLGTDPARLYRLRRSGAAREAASIDALDGGFYLVGNDPKVALDGAWGLVPNFGRSSLVAFDPRAGVVTGELPLGKGPGQMAYDPATGAVVALEVNGTASRVLFANVVDMSAVSAGARPLASARPARGAGRTGAVLARRDGASADRPRVATFSTVTKSFVEWEPRSRPK